jgi:hypothetical protein
MLTKQKTNMGYTLFQFIIIVARVFLDFCDFINRYAIVSRASRSFQKLSSRITKG